MPDESSIAENSRSPLRIANIEFRPVELQALADGRRVGFTIREFELCFLLSQRLDAVVQRPEIYTEIWGGEMPSRNRSVDVLVRKVRAKLERTAPEWRYVHTHFGVGYRFMPEPLSGEASNTALSKPLSTGSAA